MTDRRAVRPAEAPAEAPAAAPGGPDAALGPQGRTRGIAIRASLAGAARLREETRAGLFPLRLTPEDWASGGNHRLPRVSAPNPRSAATVTGNVNRVAKDRRMELHTGILGLPDAETLKSWESTVLADHAAIAPSADFTAAHSAVRGGE